MSTTLSFAPISDAHLFNNGNTYATIHNAATASSITTPVADDVAMCVFYNPNYQIRRYAVDFDTSAIPNGAIIISATLSMWGTSLTNAGDGAKVNIYASSAANTKTTADYNKYGTTAFSTAKDVSSGNWVTGAYNAFALNASGLANISTTSRSKFFFMEAVYDNANTTPTAVSIAGYTGSNYGVVARRPKLEVTYELKPVVDATSNTRPTGNSATTTWSHTCTSASYLYVVIGAGDTTTGVTYNGVAMTNISEDLSTVCGAYISSWYLASPAAGANDIVATHSSSMNTRSGNAVSVAYVSGLGINGRQTGNNAYTGVSMALPGLTPYSLLLDTFTGRGTVDGSPSYCPTANTGQTSLIRSKGITSDSANYAFCTSSKAKDWSSTIDVGWTGTFDTQSDYVYNYIEFLGASAPPNSASFLLGIIN
jgi:hypothetical protein